MEFFYTLMTKKSGHREFQNNGDPIFLTSGRQPSAVR